MAHGSDAALATLRDSNANETAISEALVRLVEAGHGAAGLQLVPTAANPVWRVGAEKVERAAQSLSDAQARSMALVLAGAIWEVALQKTDQAVGSYQAAFRLWPKNREALQRARRIYAAAENIPLVRRLLEMEIQAAESSAERSELLVESGLLARRLNEPAATVDAWFARALSEDPLNERARALVHGDATPSFEQRVAQLHGALAQTAAPRDRARLLVALARMIQEEGGGRGGDPAALLAEAAELDPANADVQKQRARALAMTGDVEALGDSLEALAALSEDPAERLDALVRLAEARLSAGDVAGADIAVDRVLEESPRNERALVVASRVAARRGDWGGAAEALDRALEISPRGVEQVELLREAGILQWRYVEDIEAAEKYFRRLKLIEPRDEPTLHFYVDYFEQRGEGRKLIATLRSLSELADGPATMALHVRIARASEELLHDAVAAIDAWAQVLKSEPSHAEGNTALRRLLRAAGRWNRLLELLRADLDACGTERGPEWTATQAEIASIYEEHLNLPARAVAGWTAVLDSDPLHLRAFEALGSHFESAGRYAELARMIEARAARVSDPDEARALLLRAARLYRDELANPQLALPSLWVLADRDPDDLDVIELERDCLRATGDWRSLVSVLLREGRARGVPDGLPSLRAACDVASQHLAAAEQLEPLMRLVDATDFNDDSAVVAASDVLAKLERPEDRLQLLRRRAALPASMPAALSRSLLSALRSLGAPAAEIAAAADHLVDVSESSDDQITALQARFEATPEDREAGEQLAELYAQSGQRAQAVAMLAELVARVSGNEAGIYLQRLVDLCVSHSGSQVEAFRWAAELFDCEPDLAQFEQANDLAGRAHRDDEWIDTLRIFADRDNVDDNVRLRCLDRAAELLAARTGREAEAIPLLERIRTLRADDLDVLRRLAALYKAHATWGEWFDVAEQLVELELDATTRRALLAELAYRHETEGSDLDAALGAILRQIEAGTDPASLLGDVERLAALTGRWGRLVTVYEELLGARPSASDAIAWRLRLAELYRHRLGDDAEAEEQLRTLLLDDPGNLEALHELDSILLAGQDWDALVEVVETRIQYADTADEAVAQINRLVVLHRHSRSDAPAAASAAARLVDAVPFDVDARETLLQLLEQCEQYEELARRLGAEIGLEDAGESVADATLRLATVLVSPLQRIDDAVVQLATLVGAGNRSDAVRALLNECAEDDGQAGVRARSLLVDVARDGAAPEAVASAILAHAVDLGPADRLAAVVDAIEILDEQSHDADAALAAGLAALRDGVRGEALVDALMPVASQTGDWTALANAVRDAAEEEHNTELRHGLLRRAAQLNEAQSDDIDEAIALRRLLADEGDHESIDALLGLLERAGRADELLDVAEQFSGAQASVAERVETMLSAIRRSLALGLDVREAATRLGLLVSDASNSATQLDAIAELAGTLDEWEVVAEALEARAEYDRRQGGDVAGALIRFASVCADRIGDPRRAVEALERAASISENDAILVEIGGLYDRLDEPDRLAAVFERRARVSAAPEDQAALHVAAAEVYEIRLDDVDSAIRAARAALAVAPQNAEIARYVARLYEVAERWNDFAEFDPCVSPTTSDAEREASVEARARVLAERLGRMHDALALLQSLASDGQGSWNMLAAAAGMAEEAGAALQARELFEAALERAGDDHIARAELLLRLASLLREHMGEPEQADALVRAAFDSDPTSERAQREFERVAREADDLEAQLHVNAARLQRASGDARVTLLAERAQLAADEPEQQRAALDAIASLVHSSVGTQAALTGVQALLNAQRVDDAARLLECVDVSAARSQKHLLQHLQGRILEAQGNRVAAIEAYQAAQSSTSVHLPNLLALANLLADDGQWGEALNIYLAALLHQANLSTAERVELYYRIGIARLQTGDTHRAVEMFRRALSVDPQHDASRLALEAAR